jgi:hypothetical protein
MTWAFYRESAHALPRVGREFLFWGVVLGLLWSYWEGYRVIRRGGVHPLWVWAFALGFCAFALLTVPFQSTDLFGYINRGWQQVHYGANPYVFTVDDMPGWGTDPMFRNHWVDNPCPYGFLFALVAWGICTLGGGDWQTTMLLFKAASLLAFLAAAGLVWWGASRFDSRPTAAISALYLLTWNPLMLMHEIANGHNDILMGALTTLGVFASLGAGWLLTVPALVGAGFIKYLALILIPFAGVYLWRTRGRGATFSAMALGFVTFLAVASPYLPQWQQFRLDDMGTNATLTHNSLPAMIHHFYKNVLAKLIPALEIGVPWVKTGVKMLVWGGFALFYGWRLWALAKMKKVPEAKFRRRWVESALLVQFVLVCVVSSKFYAWYIGMFFPLALVLPEGHWLRRLVVGVSCAQLFSLTFLGQAHMVNYLVMMLLPIGWVTWQEFAKHHRARLYRQVSVLPTLSSQSLTPQAG